MTSFDQVPFNASEFVDNPEPRCPCLLLLDTSTSMQGAKIDELNSGLAGFQSQLTDDGLAAKRVEVAIMSFGPVELHGEFTTAEHFAPPVLRANGNTPMGEAIGRGIDEIERRKKLYREQGISYYRPWMFMITDGAPTDDWKPAASRIRFGEEAKSFSFFAIGIEGANMEVLNQIAVRAPLYLKGLEFASMFTWLSNSMASVSHSTPGEDIPLTNPVAPDGWASV